MGVKIEFLSVWNRNFDTIDARFYCLEINDRPVLPIYLPFYNEIYTRTYVSSHTFPTRGRIYLQLPLESVNPVFQRISTVYIDIWLRLYSPRAVNHYSVAAALFFCIPSFSSSPASPLPTRYSVALHRNYTKRPTRDDAGVKHEIGRVPRVRRVPSFENCPVVLVCPRLRPSNAICRQSYICFRSGKNVQLFTKIKYITRI